MKKIVRCLLFIVLFFIVLGFSKSKAESYSPEEYKAKYGNLMLVATIKDSDWFDPSGMDVNLDIDETFEFDTCLIDYDTYKNEGYDEAMANRIMIDTDKLENIKIYHPNLIEYENGVITAKAEGFSSISFSCEYEGKKYDSVDYVGGDILVGERTIELYIKHGRECLEDVFYSIVSINNSKMILNNNNKSDSAVVSAWPDIMVEPYSSDFQYDIRDQELYTFEWSIDDESIVSIEEAEKDPDNLFKLWESEIVVTGKKNGTTKVRCKVSAPAEEGGITTVEKVIDVTVQGFEEENNTEEDPKKDDDNESKNSGDAENKNSNDADNKKSDNTVANKPLSKTGEKFIGIVFIGALIVVSIVMLKRYSKYSNKEIK